MKTPRKILGIIPARYGGTRFPGKPLAPILGKPMILWVLEGASGSKHLADIIVATDDESILSTVRNAGFKAEMTRSDHPSGTDRIWEVARRYEYTHILNIQGDEPLITGKVIDQLIEILDEKRKMEMATMVKRFGEYENPCEPNRVKVVIDDDGRALYFSRALIPCPMNREAFQDYPYLLHIGLYLYKYDFLKRFIEYGPCHLERIERLEQLRALAMGVRIETVLTDSVLISVDTPDDIRRVEAYLSGPIPA